MSGTERHPLRREVRFGLLRHDLRPRGMNDGEIANLRHYGNC